MKYVIFADTWFQKQVEALAHECMRTFDVTKGFLRYCLLIATAAFLILDPEVFEAGFLGWKCALNMLFALVLVFAGVESRAVSDSAHSRGLLCPYDVSKPFFKLLGAAFFLSSLLHVRETIGWSLFLAIEYLAGVSPFPPPSEMRRAIWVPEAAT